MLLTKRELGLKDIALVLFSHLWTSEKLFTSFEHWSQQIIEHRPTKWLSVKDSPCLRLDLVFEAVLVTEPFMIWILKEQFLNPVAPWNMPNLSLFTATLCLGSF